MWSVHHCLETLDTLVGCGRYFLHWVHLGGVMFFHIPFGDSYRCIPSWCTMAWMYLLPVCCVSELGLGLPTVFISTFFLEVFIHSPCAVFPALGHCLEVWINCVWYSPPWVWLSGCACSLPSGCIPFSVCCYQKGFQFLSAKSWCFVHLRLHDVHMYIHSLPGWVCCLCMVLCMPLPGCVCVCVFVCVCVCVCVCVVPVDCVLSSVHLWLDVHVCGAYVHHGLCVLADGLLFYALFAWCVCGLHAAVVP